VTSKNNPVDTALMNVALGLAQRGLGNTAPNPAVGCVLARPDLDHRIVGRGWTQAGGRPHAETEAIRRAGDLACGATAYVTLEPCCHHGQTPPCTDALIAAGIARVVIAAPDPDDRVAGGGVEALKNAGMDVSVGLLEGEANRVNAGFLKRITKSRPHITLKTATSLDGCIATNPGQQQWITGEPARAYGHYLRARNDAILTGMGTVRADNPSLTCRLPGLGHASPIRVVMDPRLEIPDDSNLVSTARSTPTWVITGADCGPCDADGLSVFHLELDTGGKLAPAAVMTLLAEQGINRVLLEAGGKLNAAFLHAGLVDEIYWFRAPVVIGGDGVSAIEGVCVDQMADVPGFKQTGSFSLGVDQVEIYEAISSAP
jgi:diaminohydroxyphosphoribosylaminopyrimidine deaminase / 5-amino-6-(5-phosphoribosylamino)uracil reductase